MPARAFLLLVLVLAACEIPPRSAGAEPVDSLKLRPGYVVDSIFPMEEMLRRFREPLGEPVFVLARGAESRDGLVRAFVRALAERDDAALERLRIDESEFAWIYFPSSPFAAPPYELPPEVLWLQLDAESSKGLARATRLIGAGLVYLGHECKSAPEVYGSNRLWSECVVHWRRPDGREERFRLFGSILEHGGRFEFVSYANQL